MLARIVSADPAQVAVSIRAGREGFPLSGSRVAGVAVGGLACPEQRVAAVAFGDELLVGDLQASLVDPGPVGDCASVAPPHGGGSAEPVVLGAGHASCPVLARSHSPGRSQRAISCNRRGWRSSGM